MKTDKFGKSIREKLESVDPPYQEKDWLQFRSFLRHHGVPSIGGGVQWLMPTLSAAAVTGLLVTSVWLYRTNQHLEQKVQTLSRTITRLEKAPAVTPVRPDTVYITREVPVSAAPADPSSSSEQPMNNPAPERVLTNPFAQERLAVRPTQPVESQPVESTVPEPAGRSKPATTNDPTQPDKTRATSEPVSTSPREQSLANNRPNVPMTTDPTTTAPATAAPTTAVPTTAVPTTQPNSITERFSKAVRPDRSRPDRSRSENRLGQKQERTPSNGAGNPYRESAPAGTAPSERIARADGTVPASTGGTSATDAATASPEWLNVNFLSGQPLRFDSSYFVERFTRQTRRIRPNWRSAVAIPPAQPTSVAVARPAIEEPTPLFRFRIGGSSSVGIEQWTVGGVAEILIGKHWAVGIGLNRMGVSSPQYKTDKDFFERTKRDFRRDYASRIDPKHQIMDINRRNVNVQVPITVGYRLPLGNNVTIIPTAGISLSVQAREYVHFTYRRAPLIFSEPTEAKFYANRPTDWYNNGLMSINIEKQWGHWVVQGGPYLSTPLKVSPMGLNKTSAGMQARLLFQF